VSLQKKLEDKLDTILVDMAKQRKVYTKTSDFRVSGLPICPLRTLLYNERADSYSMDFYTSIGTAVHETAQKWLSVGNFKNNIFACWKIKETGEILGPCFKDEIPEKYSNYTIEYEEITINYRVLSGHVDLVLEIFPGQYMVVDFKTTDLDGKKRRFSTWQNQYPASRSSIIQISTYSTLLRKLFKLNIVAWCLVYVDRGKVINSKDDYYKVTRPWTKMKHRNMLEHLDRACENNARLQRLNRMLEDSDEFNPKAVKVLKQLVVNRPCVDDESYNAWMDYKFFRKAGPGEAGVFDGQCIMKKHCLSGSKACYSALKRQL